MAEQLGRTVAIVPRPGSDESLDSWIARWASLQGVSRAAILTLVNVSRRFTQPAELSEDAGARLAHATGIAEDDIRAMTLEIYERRGLRFGDVRNGALGLRPGVKAVTRVCGHCIAKTGQWKLEWQLALSFACLEHRTLLADTCPGHGQAHRVAVVSRRPAQIREVWACPSSLKDGTVCEYDLRAIAHERLPPEHPVLRAQAQIYARLQESSPTGVQDYVRDIRAVSTGAAQEKDLLRVADVAGLDGRTLLGFDGTSAFNSLLPQLESNVEAAFATYAVRVVDDLSAGNTSNLLIPLVDYARQFSNRTTPTKVAARWGRMSSKLNTQISDLLSPSVIDLERLRFYSPLPPKLRPQASLELIARRASSVPQLLWRSISAAFVPIGDPREVDFRWACSQALLLPGSPSRSDEEVIRYLYRHGRAPGPSYLTTLPAELRAAVYEALCRLADELDGTSSPIDYGRRRQLDYNGLLDETRWVRSPFVARYKHSRLKRAEVELYLWSRLTGSHPAAAPFWMGGNVVDVTKLEDRKMSAAEQAQAEDVATAFLREHGIDNEPLSWSPEGY